MSSPLPIFNKLTHRTRSIINNSRMLKFLVIGLTIGIVAWYRQTYITSEISLREFAIFILWATSIGIIISQAVRLFFLRFLLKHKKQWYLEVLTFTEENATHYHKSLFIYDLYRENFQGIKVIDLIKFALCFGIEIFLLAINQVGLAFLSAFFFYFSVYQPFLFKRWLSLQEFDYMFHKQILTIWKSEAWLTSGDYEVSPITFSQDYNFGFTLGVLSMGFFGIVWDASLHQKRKEILAYILKQEEQTLKIITTIL